jgi:hypothetical protein
MDLKLLIIGLLIGICIGARIEYELWKRDNG